MQIIEDFKAVTGSQKAAILMLALGEEQRSKLFGLMQEDEIKLVSAAMSQLGAVRASIVDQLCSEFKESLGSQSSLVGSLKTTERLLLQALPADRAAQIMDEIRGPAGSTMWEKLGNVSEIVLANYLRNEYPQTAAVILSKLRPDHTGKVLAQLPESFAIEVIMRMLHMRSIQREVLQGVEETLRTEFMSNLSSSQPRDSHELMAEIFNSLDRQSETRFIIALEDRNKEAAEKIKALMFTFDDLRRLSPSSIQILLRNAEKDKLPLALKGASQSLRDLVFQNLSERAGKMLREDIELLGPVKLRDVDDAQAGLVTLAKDLAAQGQIEINDNSSDEMVA